MDFEDSDDADWKSLNVVEDNDLKYVFLYDDSDSGLKSDELLEDVISGDDVLVDDFNECPKNSDDDSWAETILEVFNDFILDFEEINETLDSDFKQLSDDGTDDKDSDVVESDDSKFSFNSDAIDEASEDVISCDKNSVDDLNEYDIDFDFDS